MTTSTAQTLVIRDWLPDQVANGSHRHWTVLYSSRKRAKEIVWVEARRANLNKLHGRAKLTITLVFAQKRRRDYDNLVARCKPIMDALVRGGWLVDDDSAHLELVVRAEVCRGTRETRITLEAV